MSRPATPRDVPGAVVGAPPTLEWISVDRLKVDPAYQRATDGHHSRRIIFGMFKAWDWTLCQPLVVSRRNDGELFILDGQHRHEGAVKRGDVHHLPCVILAGVGHAGEAEAFVALNTKRQRLSQADLFNAMLAAGDEIAIATAALLEQTGWRIRRSCNTQVFQPGDLVCAPMLAREVRISGEAAVRNALTALREAYPDQPVSNTATLLKALIPIYRDGDLDGGDPDLFIETLGTVEPADWDDYGREQRRKAPVLTRIEGISAAMLAAYRDAQPNELEAA